MKTRWWTRLFSRKKPQVLIAAPPAASEAEIVKVETAPATDLGSAPQGEQATENSPVIDVVAEPVRALPESDGEAPLPATVPKPALPAHAPSDDWLRSRALYFAAANYSSPAGSERILSPDLLFRLGIERHRSQAEATPVPEPAAQLPTPSVKLAPRPMEGFATAENQDAARSDPAGRVLSVDPLLLTLFFSKREAGPGVPVDATTEYLTDPALLERGVTLRDRVLQNWAARGAPLSPRQFYELARSVAGHPGTALLLCHNTAKAFARGGEAIRWRIVNRNRGEYDDGKSKYTAAILHREGVLKSGPLAPPSLFFLLFSAAAFGTADTGDWYRFFSSAAAMYYAATKQSRVPVLSPSSEVEQVARWIDELAQAVRDPSAEWSPAYRAWLWVNAWTFFESGQWGSSQAEIRRENIVSLQGAAFGLKEAAPTAACDWNWLVPVKGVRFARPFDHAASIAERIAPESGGSKY
jgi:hypothetical protein